MTNLIITLAMLTAIPATPEAEAVRWALGEIESGQNDEAVGKSGEISRYQICPAVWMQAAPNVSGAIGNWEHEPIAWKVAHLILQRRISNAFADRVTPQDLYLLWNRPGLWWHRKKASGRVAARCRRFATLYELKLKELKR